MSPILEEPVIGDRHLARHALLRARYRHQFQERFMEQRCGLQRVSVRLSAPLFTRDSVQLTVHQRHQLIERLLVPVHPGRE